MILVVSPSKSLNMAAEVPHFARIAASQPSFLSQSEALIKVLRGFDRVELMQLMEVSEKIADLNVLRIAEWSLPFTPENAKEAVFAFTGDVYLGMKPELWSERAVLFAQQHLRILSGLYGVLRPLDLIQAYRLEMGRPLKTDVGNNLYAFWKTAIASSLAAELEQQNDTVLVNLASEEYVKAVDRKALKAEIYDIDFKETTKGGYKTVSFHAKRARGMMTDYVVRNEIADVADLKVFSEGGYAFDVALSSASRWVFTR